MFKINKDANSLFKACSSVSIVNFEHVVAGWGSDFSALKHFFKNLVLSFLEKLISFLMEVYISFNCQGYG